MSDIIKLSKSLNTISSKMESFIKSTEDFKNNYKDIISNLDIQQINYIKLPTV